MALGVPVHKTGVSDAGVQELVAARPDLNVQFGVENH